MEMKHILQQHNASFNRCIPRSFTGVYGSQMVLAISVRAVDQHSSFSK
jgi:hypothetical protein